MDWRKRFALGKGDSLASGAALLGTPALVNAQELGLLSHLKALSESGEWERIVVDGPSTSAAVKPDR